MKHKAPIASSVPHTTHNHSSSIKKLQILHTSEDSDLANTTYTYTRLIYYIYTKSLTLSSSKIPRHYPHFLIRLCKKAQRTRGYFPHEIAQLQFACKILLDKDFSP